MHFPTAGIDVFPLVPPLVAFAISFFTSMGGVSGAFLLLPFQVSVLGFTTPAVSPTNMVYNIVGIPGGVYRYIREGRMAWALAGVIVAGSLPGIFAGVVVRIRFLPDPGVFKFFVGCVLLFIGARLCLDILKGEEMGKGKGDVPADREAGGKTGRGGREEKAGFGPAGRRTEETAGSEATGSEAAGSEAAGSEAAGSETAGSETADLSPGEALRQRRADFSSIAYSFRGETFSFNPVVLAVFSAAIGVVGGIYGIGGGAVIAPFLVAVFRLPVHAVAGAALLSTFVSSAAGVAFYTLAAPAFAETGLAVSPDWMLGFLFGLGGLAGTYLGARTQKFFPAKAVKVILALSITALAARYIVGFFT